MPMMKIGEPILDKNERLIGYVSKRREIPEGGGFDVAWHEPLGHFPVQASAVADIEVRTSRIACHTAVGGFLIWQLFGHQPTEEQIEGCDFMTPVKGTMLPDLTWENVAMATDILLQF